MGWDFTYCTVQPIKVSNPIMELVMKSCDEAALLEVQHVT